MMNPELKAKWVAALRSGNYLQGHGALERVVNGISYNCCLGVLCRIMGVQEIPYDLDPAFVAFGGCVSTPPIELQKEAGLQGHEINALVCLNDGYTDAVGISHTSTSFHRIADYIEANL